MIARQQHVNNPIVLAGQNTDHLVRISYSDGAGRILMHKAQCEPTAENGHKGWIGSGRTIYNNKGNVVMQFEPYFSSTHLCDTTKQATSLGVSPKMFYDALNRVYHTEMTDGTFNRTEWTAWEQTFFDSNDTVTGSSWYATLNALALPTNPTAEQVAVFNARKDTMNKSAAYFNTPTVIHTDSLARPFYTIQQDSPNNYIHAYAELDIAGNQVAVIDGNRINTIPLVKTLQYRYNMLQQACRQDSIDGGTGHALIDVAGQPLYTWDTDERKLFMVYDELRRPIQKVLSDTIVLEEMIYGEGQTGDTEKNLRGRLCEHHDGAGRHWMPDGYDFKGNPFETKLRLIATNSATDIDWTSPPTLSIEEFTRSALMDALGRPVQVTDAGGNVTTHIYDLGGALKAVKLNGDTYVQDIHYDAKGQRQAIWYGNGTKTGYTYDPLTYRLTRLLTVNVDSGSSQYNQQYQDLNYYYDAVGNITRITDKAQATVFYDNTVIRPEQTYTYDALYRLIEATGRESIGDTTGNDADNYSDASLMSSAASPFDGNALQNYTQIYAYDAVGNMLSLQHVAGTGSYTRTFSYTNASNRLNSTTVGSHLPYEYSYDARGNMLTMPHLNTLNWNAGNQLSSIGRGTGMTARYQYSGGQRIRKVVEKTGITEERIYLGSYEIYRRYVADSLTLERNTVHVSDNTGRIAMLEVKTVDTAGDLSPALLKRFIYSNHLQSAGLELDNSGAVISYEEYHPYGTTAYQAMDSNIKAAAKRYRFTGKERDEESGLNYHGARYYALWLCRWISVDPLESKYAPQSSYVYCSCNPINRTDPSGMGDNDKKTPAPNFGLASLMDVTSQYYVYRDNTGWHYSNISIGSPYKGVELNNSPVQVGSPYANAPAGLYTVKQAQELESRQNEYVQRMKNPTEIADADVYGKGYIGPTAVVRDQIFRANSQWGEDIKDGVFGSYGSVMNGPAGARRGAIADGVVMSLAPHSGTPFGRTEAPVETRTETFGQSSGPIVEQRPVEKYQFEREGYSYRVNEEVTSKGKSIAHMVEKGGEVTLVGYSSIDNNGVLTNVFEVPISLRGKGISKAMYEYLNKTGFDAIDAVYNPSSDNFKVFTSIYDPSKNNALEAAMATPAARAMGPGFTPTNINIESSNNQITKISIIWSRKTQ